MRADSFRTALDIVSLSQRAAARLFGADERTVRRWVLGERNIPVSVAILVRLLVAKKITVKDIDTARGR